MPCFERMLNDFKSADKIHIACGYTDLRRGIDGLAGIVQEQFRLNLMTNTLFVFCGRRCDRIKALYWEGYGFVLLYKRLETGSFQWPRTTDEVRQLSPQQYRWLMEGLAVEQPKAHRETNTSWVVWNAAGLRFSWYNRDMKAQIVKDNPRAEMVSISREEYEAVKAQNVLRADETSLQVLHEPGKPATSKSYMWLYWTSGDTDKPIVLYEYQPTRAAEHPRKFLEGFTGYLHTDGYQVYGLLSSDITVVGCLAHCRRKFDAAVNALGKAEQGGSPALKGLWYSNRLFDLEKELADNTPEERYKQR